MRRGRKKELRNDTGNVGCISVMQCKESPGVPTPWRSLLASVTVQTALSVAALFSRSNNGVPQASKPGNKCVWASSGIPLIGK